MSNFGGLGHFQNFHGHLLVLGGWTPALLSRALTPLRLPPALGLTKATPAGARLSLFVSTHVLKSFSR